MANFKVTELFGGWGHPGATIQGEGRFVGVPSVFLRVFGCNFECRGFGLPRGQKTVEPEEILHMVAANPSKYQTLNDIPLATTGCDSYASWHKGFRHLSKDYTTDELVEEIGKLSPTFEQHCHLVITGGEPLLIGQQKKYPELLEKLHHKYGLLSVTFETNGTQELCPEFIQWVNELDLPIKLYFSCSVKLECSGEPKDQRINFGAISSYEQCLIHNGQTRDDLWFKFVAGSKEDFDEVASIMNNEFAWFTQTVYIMPIGGTLDELNKYEPFVINECLERGYSFSPRYHVRAFGNSWGK